MFITSGAPATSNSSMPFLSRSSNWIVCTWVKLARCVGYTKTDTHFRNTDFQLISPSIRLCSTYIWAFVCQITDSLLRPNGELYWYHPTRLSHNITHNQLKHFIETQLFILQPTGGTADQVRDYAKRVILHANVFKSKFNSPREHI